MRVSPKGGCLSRVLHRLIHGRSRMKIEIAAGRVHRVGLDAAAGKFSSGWLTVRKYY